jgi:hypothetical protein
MILTNIFLYGHKGFLHADRGGLRFRYIKSYLSQRVSQALQTIALEIHMGGTPWSQYQAHSGALGAQL